MSHSPEARAVEAKEGLPLREALERALLEEKTVAGVARRFGIERRTVYDWMHREGVQRPRREQLAST